MLYYYRCICLGFYELKMGVKDLKIKNNKRVPASTLFCCYKSLIILQIYKCSYIIYICLFAWMGIDYVCE